MIHAFNTQAPLHLTRPSHVPNLQDLLTRLMVAGLTVYQKHEEWHAQKIYPADTFEGQFVFRSAQQLAKGSQSVWVALQVRRWV